MSDQNLTPDQRAMPRPVRAAAYQRIPETCDRLRELLDALEKSVMQDCGIPPEDEATVDAITSLAFQHIRDQITQPFRTEQMRLIHQLMQRGCLDETPQDTI